MSCHSGGEVMNEGQCSGTSVARFSCAVSFRDGPNWDGVASQWPRERTGRAQGSEPVPFGPRLAGSDMFRAVFDEGMTLVEETADYLDGDGRKESRRLTRAGVADLRDRIDAPHHPADAARLLAASAARGQRRRDCPTSRRGSRRTRSGSAACRPRPTARAGTACRNGCGSSSPARSASRSASAARRGLRAPTARPVVGNPVRDQIGRIAAAFAARAG